MNRWLLVLPANTDTTLRDGLSVKHVDVPELAARGELRASASDRIEPGGGTATGAFEQRCRLRQIKLFVLPPCSSKLNGSGESAQRTHTEESYIVYDLLWSACEIRPRLPIHT